MPPNVGLIGINKDLQLHNPVTPYKLQILVLGKPAEIIRKITKNNILYRFDVKMPLKFFLKTDFVFSFSVKLNVTMSCYNLDTNLSIS